MHMFDAGYVPELAFNLVSLVVTHKRTVGLMTEEGLCVSLFDGRLRVEGGGSTCSNFVYRIAPDKDYVTFTLLAPDSTENRVETVLRFSLGVSRFPCLPPVAALLLRML